MSFRGRRLVGLSCAGLVLASTATATSTSEASDLTRISPRAAGNRSAVAPAAALSARIKQLPLGGTRVFPDYQLVAFYGTAHTPSLGVLGEGTPPRMTKRLRAAARPFHVKNKRIQIVYELIVSVADAHAGSDGTYSHYIPRAYVQKFVDVARRNKALLVLDIQPGRESFLPQARHFRWALRQSFVGLALDPEWRMGPRQVPARTIGHVGAVEVNRVSRLLADVTRRNKLPEKLFVIHQFRREMVRNIARVKSRAGLAMVQHIDGFGSRAQKLATFHHVAEPSQLTLGFKLFYDEDTDLFRPREVLAIRPRISFVSYQ